MASPFDRVGGVSSIATGEQIGSAGFTIFADAGNFFDTLGKAETAARRTGSSIGRSLGKGGDLAMGLLYAGQAVDDLQYGFRAIVNNIPSLTMALGGGAGLAGAVGIAAVAVNQLAQHWEELKATFGDTQFIRDVTAFAKQIAPNTQGGLGPLQMLNVIQAAAAPKAALAAGRSADIEAGQKLWEKAEGSVVDKQKAADFAKAIEESGGLKAVIDSALKAAMAAPGADEATQKGRIAKWVNEGMKGGQFNPGAFSPQFGQVFDAQEKRRERARGEKGEEDARHAREARQKMIDARNEREDQIDALIWQEGIREKAQGLRDRAKFLTDKARDMGSSQVLSDTRAYVGKITTDALNSIPQKQLDEAKRLNDKADQMIKALEKENRRFAVFK